MKYLFTIRSLTGGGAERVVSVLANMLAKQGNDVNIAVYGRTERDYAVDDAVNVVVMPQRKDSFLTKIKRISDMRHIINTVNPEVVIPFVGTVLYVTWLACVGKHIKFVLTIRNNPWVMPESNRQRAFRDYIAKKADLILVQNEEQASYFGYNDDKKIRVLPNPISAEFLRNPKKDYASKVKTIITAGRLNYQKNQKLLIKGFSEICKREKNLKLLIYGEGPMRDELNELIEELGLTESVCLMGRGMHMEQILTSADVFVMTSDFEGMPNALMEAMAVGLPCISSDCKTGPSSLIKHGKTGLLFETGNLSDFEEKLLWAVEHSNEMNLMGKNARVEMLERYTPENISMHAEDIFKDIV